MSPPSGMVSSPLQTTDIPQMTYRQEKLMSSSPSIISLAFDTPLEHLPAHPNVDTPNLRVYESPLAWSSTRKTLCLTISCCATLLAAYSAGAYSIAASLIEQDFSVSSTAFQTGITTWCVGFAISPMILAPLSELYGRRPVFLFSGLMFFVAQIGCAVTHSFAGMLIARFFVGAGASTFATMVGGVVSDIYDKHHRNSPMAVYSASALTGTGTGPLISGFIVQRVSWRWVFWHQVIALGVIMTLMAAFFKETRGSVLLERKAEKLNKHLAALRKEHQTPTPEKEVIQHTFNLNTTYVVSAGIPSTSLFHLIYLSLTIPFKLLFTEPIVFFFSLWAAFAWAILYMTLNVLPLVFSTNHNFNIQEQGATFASIVIGTIIGMLLSIYQERIVKRLWPRFAVSTEQPEGRLYFACLEAALLPIGLFWFGWTNETSIHWVVPCLGICCAVIGIFVIYLAVFNYFADVYLSCASSAMACQGFCRNILAAVFPLFSQIMFKRLGYPGASSLLGGLAALLTIVPWVLVFKGDSIRARSKMASKLVSD